MIFEEFVFDDTIAAKTDSGRRKVFAVTGLVRQEAGSVFATIPSSQRLFFPPRLMCMAGTHTCIACSRNASAPTIFTRFRGSPGEVGSQRTKKKRNETRERDVRTMMAMTQQRRHRTTKTASNKTSFGQKLRVLRPGGPLLSGYCIGSGEERPPPPPRLCTSSPLLPLLPFS